MATPGEILVRLGIDPSGLAAGEAAATGAFGRIESSARTMAAGLVAAFGVFSVSTVLGDAVRDAQAAETSIAVLTQSLQNNVAGWNGDMTAIDAAAQANLRYGVTATQTYDSLGLIVAATHSLDEALAVQNTALDLAAFKHISLQEATQALVNIEAGRARGLATLGINVKDFSTIEERMAAVHQVTAGAADALANTETGKLSAAQASISESMEKLGVTLLPAVASGMQVVADVSTVVADNLNTIEPVAEALALTIGVKMAAGALAAGINVLGLGTAAATATPEVAGLGAAAATSAGEVEGLGTAAGAAATGGVAGLGLSIGQLAAPLALMVGFKDQITGFFGGLMNGVNNFIVGSNPFSDRVNAITQGFGHLTPAVLTNTAAIGQQTAALVDLTGATRDTDGQIGEMDSAVQTFNGVMNGATAQIGTATDAIAQFGLAAFGVTGYVGQTDDTVKGLEATLKDTYGITINDGDAALYLARGMDAAAVAAQQAEAALRAFNREHPVNTGLPGGTADAQRQFSLGTTNTSSPAAGDKAALDAANKAWQDSMTAAATAARTTVAHITGSTAAASAAFSTLAADAKASMASAFGTIKEYADNYFDALHRRNLEAIQDSHDRKAAAIQDAKDAANAAIDADETALRGKLSALQQAIDARKAAEQLEQLQTNLANAQASGDQSKISAAQQALSDFEDQQQLAALQAQTNAQIAADEAKRKAADDAATAAAKANDAETAAAKKAEDTRAADQKTAFDKALAALQSSLGRHPEEWAKTQQEIVDLLGKYGVTIANAGTKVGTDYANNLAAALNAGIGKVGTAGQALADAAAGKLALHTGATSAPQLASAAPLPPVNLTVNAQLDGETLLTFVSKGLQLRQGALTSGLGNG